MENKKIIFLGTPDISAFVLEGLINNGFNIVGVITKEDKVRGRNNQIDSSPVAKIAEKYNIPLHKPHKLNQDYQFIIDKNPDLLLTFAYGQIISETVLHLSKYKPLNLHASLLPKYRGAAPIQYCLKNGEKETGVSLMEMVAKMDAGDVYAVNKIDILDDDNYTSLANRLAKSALDLAIEALPKYFNNELIPVAQDENLVTFCPSIKKEEEILSLKLSPADFVNKVRALSYNPGAYLYMNNEILKIFKAKYYSDKKEYVPGQLIKLNKKELMLQLNDGQVLLEELQKPGKKITKAVDFINGTHDIDKIILHE